MAQDAPYQTITTFIKGIGQKAHTIAFRDYSDPNRHLCLAWANALSLKRRLSIPGAT
jgi:hypothetical protein